MKSIEKFAKSGGMVFGICNGFQILLEAGLLPGAVMRNTGLRYILRHVNVRIEERTFAFTSAATKGQIVRIPIAHSDGNYNCDEATLAELRKRTGKSYSGTRTRTGPMTMPAIQTARCATSLVFAVASATLRA